MEHGAKRPEPRLESPAVSLSTGTLGQNTQGRPLRRCRGPAARSASQRVAGSTTLPLFSYADRSSVQGYPGPSSTLGRSHTPRGPCHPQVRSSEIESDYLTSSLKRTSTTGQGSNQCLSVMVTTTFCPLMRYSPLTNSWEKRPDPSSPAKMAPFSLAALLPLASSEEGKPWCPR